MFDGCNSLEEIVVPMGKRSKYENYFPDLKDKIVEQI